MHASGAEKLPIEIVEYLESHTKAPLALVGCRAYEDSLACCEYDVLVFEEGGSNRVVRAGNHSLEIIHCKEVSGRFLPQGKIVVLRDSNDFSLSSLVSRHSEKQRMKRFLTADGRKMLVSSLFHLGRAEKSPVVSAMFLKFASYEFIQGVLMLAGLTPMPAHELRMVRQAELGDRERSGIEMALQGIGSERATRPAMQRSIEATSELISGNHDRELNLQKIGYMLENEMLSDCHYFIGRLAKGSLIGKRHDYHEKYSKLIQIAMDLNVDPQWIEKSRDDFTKIVKNVLSFR